MPLFRPAFHRPPKRDTFFTVPMLAAAIAFFGTPAFAQSADTRLNGQMAITQGLTAHGENGGTLMPSNRATSCEEGKRLLSGADKREGNNGLPDSLLDDVPGRVGKNDTVIVGSVTVICP